MANPPFEPVIGSGFDSLAAQRQYWSRFNEGVDTGNIQRANAAEQTQNSYLAQLAQARQSALERDAAAQRQQQQQDQQASLAAAAAAEHARQFDVGTRLSEEGLANQRLATKSKQDKEDQQQQDFVDQLTSIGKAAGPDAAKAGQVYEDALKAYQDAENSAQLQGTKLATNELKGLPVAYSPKVHQLVWTNRAKPPQAGDLDKIAKANATLAETAGEESNALQELRQAATEHKKFETLNPNLYYTKQGGKWGLLGTHPKLNNKFFTTDPTEAAGIPAQPPSFSAGQTITTPDGRTLRYVAPTPALAAANRGSDAPDAPAMESPMTAPALSFASSHDEEPAQPPPAGPQLQPEENALQYWSRSPVAQAGLALGQRAVGNLADRTRGIVGMARGPLEMANRMQDAVYNRFVAQPVSDIYHGVNRELVNPAKHALGAAARAILPPSKIRVRTPDGREGYIDQSQLQEAKDAGYTILDT